MCSKFTFLTPIFLLLSLPIFAQEETTFESEESYTAFQTPRLPADYYFTDEVITAYGYWGPEKEWRYFDEMEYYPEGRVIKIGPRL
ncbi:MAG: hypothetical protein AAFQ68_23585, partial [Bacteroidota bacterium]